MLPSRYYLLISILISKSKERGLYQNKVQLSLAFTQNYSKATTVKWSISFQSNVPSWENVQLFYQFCKQEHIVLSPQGVILMHFTSALVIA